MHRLLGSECVVAVRTMLSGWSSIVERVTRRDLKTNRNLYNSPTRREPGLRRAR